MLICEYPCRRSGTPLDWILPAAGREHREVHPVAAVDRQLLHLLRIDVAASTELCVSMRALSPVTVTDSCTVDGAICRSNRSAVCRAAG
jgi:hypothetical protein